MILLKLAFRSLQNRRLTTTLTVVSIALSILLLLGVEKTRRSAKESFANTISQTDLIVGARTGATQLLLYSVFHIGDATNNLNYSTYEKVAKNKAVEWVIPISLGDSHRGYRVVATNEDFYRHYHYRVDQGLTFSVGEAAREVFDVTLGSEVARELGYSIGREIALSHGVSEGIGIDHGDKPFRVVGVMNRTGTPIDRSLYITLEGMEAIHMDWQTGAPPKAEERISPEEVLRKKIKISQITAFFVRAKTRIQSIYLQREINTEPTEPLLAIIPGVALSELWQGISYAEDGLRMIAAFVVVSGLLGMLISLYTSLNERRREMAILRSLGAGPKKILFLLVLESSTLTLAGILLGTGLSYALFALGQPLIEKQFGLYLPLKMLTTVEWIYLISAFIGGVVMGWIPALKAYRNSLQDGLTIKI
jgi:putative ABC transport system permease protein